MWVLRFFWNFFQPGTSNPLPNVFEEDETMKRMTTLLCLLLCLTLVLTGCGAKSMDSVSSEMQMTTADMAAPMEAPSMSAGTDAGNTVDAGERKLIWRADLTLETTAFDDSVALLEQRTAEFGGWVESSQFQGSSRYDSSRYGWYTLRIPAGKLDAFLSGAGEMGTVLSSSRSCEEITDSYYDAQARLTALQTQEERLLAILEQADDLDAIIRLEEALSDVRYQIEDLTGTIRRYDSLVDMATVSISLREVSSTSPVNATPTTLGGRIAQQFRDSLHSLGSFGEDLVVFLIGNLPVLLVWAVVLVGVFFGGRKVVRRVKAKRAEKREKE